MFYEATSFDQALGKWNTSKASWLCDPFEDI